MTMVTPITIHWEHSFDFNLNSDTINDFPSFEEFNREFMSVQQEGEELGPAIDSDVFLPSGATFSPFRSTRNQWRRWISFSNSLQAMMMTYFGLCTQIIRYMINLRRGTETHEPGGTSLPKSSSLTSWWCHPRPARRAY